MCFRYLLLYFILLTSPSLCFLFGMLFDMNPFNKVQCNTRLFVIFSFCRCWYVVCTGPFDGFQVCSKQVTSGTDTSGTVTSALCGELLQTGDDAPEAVKVTLHCPLQPTGGDFTFRNEVSEIF